jgi:membrane protein DedA with SNARE-associated domain/membrane-associated phospholipid phosphatase
MNAHFITQLHHYFQHHAHMGLAFAFIVAFLESLPIIGTVVPGAITMTLVGWMIGSGFVPPILTLTLASLGALTGDYISFSIGKAQHGRINQLWPFNRFPKILTKSLDFFESHGGKSILIGRFVGPARSTVPLVAGLLKMSWLRFTIAVIPTAMLWAVVYALPGIILGAFATEIPPALLTEYLMLGALFIVSCWALIWVIQYFFLNIQTFYHAQIDNYWHFLDNHRGTRLLTHYIRNRQAPHSHHQLSRALLAFVCISVFSIITLNMLFNSHLTHINYPVFHFTQSLRIYRINTLFSIVSCLGKPIVIIMLGGLTVSFLALVRQYRAAIHLAGALLVATSAVTILKHILHHARPTGMMVMNLSSSFPSGHTTLSTVCFGLIAFWTARYFPRSRLSIYNLFALLILAIGFSRILLGEHWFLDVVAGLFLGQSISLITVISYQRHPCHTTQQTVPVWQWLLFISSAFLLINGSYAALNYRVVRFQSTPFKRLVHMDQINWWQDPFSYTPQFRLNRFGLPIQPLNIQIAAPIADIHTLLHKQHWHVISRHQHITDTIYRLTKQSPQYHLPLFELLFKNERPALVAYHKTSNSKQVVILRLWNTHILFKSQQRPLWIGMLSTLKAPPHLLALPHGPLSSFPPINVPKMLLPNTTHWRYQSHKIKKTLPRAIQNLHWDKKIWLIRIYP